MSLAPEPDSDDDDQDDSYFQIPGRGPKHAKTIKTNTRTFPKSPGLQAGGFPGFPPRLLVGLTTPF